MLCKEAGRNLLTGHRELNQPNVSLFSLSNDQSLCRRHCHLIRSRTLSSSCRLSPSERTLRPVSSMPAAARACDADTDVVSMNSPCSSGAQFHSTRGREGVNDKTQVGCHYPRAFRPVHRRVVFVALRMRIILCRRMTNSCKYSLI